MKKYESRGLDNAWHCDVGEDFGGCGSVLVVMELV